MERNRQAPDDSGCHPMRKCDDPEADNDDQEEEDDD